MSRNNRKTNDRPANVTDAELAVLEALWACDTSSVRALADQLYPGGTATDYATVQKLLQRLAGKGWVERIARTSPIHYRAAMGRKALVGRQLEDVVDRLCAGSITPLLSHLTERKLSAKDRQQLDAFLDQLERTSKKGRGSKKR